MLVQRSRGLAALLLVTAASALGQAVPGALTGASSVGHGQVQVPPQANPSTLEQAVALTRNAQFADALPLWRAFTAAGNDSYAVLFNLALCEVATEQYPDAVSSLQRLKRSGPDTAAVNNLLAQAYLGEHQPELAWTAIQATALLASHDEKAYDYLLDACADHYEFALGLRTATLALQALPASQRLHYERAIFLARLDRLEEAGPEFARATVLGPETDLGYLAQIQRLLYDNDLPRALSVARTAVSAGHRDYEMLSLLGTVLLYLGAAPHQPDFQEAQAALESSIQQRPDFSTSQIALGKLYLMDGRASDAIPHLETGRRLEPRNPAVYTNLAAAYRSVGDRSAANACLQTLAALLKEASAKAEASSSN